MGAGHSHPLYLDGASPLHRAPAEVKIACLVVFVVAVVATPRESLWAFGFFGAMVMSLWWIAAIPVTWMLPRMAIEAPFVVLAVLLPIADGGERVLVAGMSLSVPGLYAAWGILVKGTLGVAASLTVAATTSARELPGALSRLGVPALFSAVLMFMLRYVDLLAGEVDRMRIARISRGDSPRALHQVGAIARGAGSVFLRAYSRGERVYVAMLSRGYDGRVPVDGLAAPATATQWAAAALPAGAAVAVAASAWLLR